MEIKKILQDPTMQKVLVLLALIMIVFWPALEGMYTAWMQDSNNSHGIVVPLIVVYLIYKKLQAAGRTTQNLQSCRPRESGDLGMSFRPQSRDLSSAIPAFAGTTEERGDDIENMPRNHHRFALQNENVGTGDGRMGSTIGLIGMVGSLLFYVFAVLMDIAVFKNLAFVLCVQSAALFVFGWPFIRQFVFPLFFLFFMVPVPVTLYGMIALPMQLFATKLSVWILQFTPLPITADGNIIRVGDAMLEVAEACSGLRSLMSFIMLSLLFAYLARTSFIKRAVIVISSIPLAICGNIIRIIFTAFVAYIYGSKVASGFLHDVSGYVMFVIAFAVFMWLGRVMEEGTS